MNIVKENNLIKVVLDSNIIISALFFGGKPHEIFNLILEKEIIGIISPFIIFEVKDVLRRRKFDIDEEKIEEVEKLLKEYFQIISPEIQVDFVENDHSDNKIIALAVEVKADYLITGDKQHLLPLKKIKKIKIISPEEFLLII